MIQADATAQELPLENCARGAPLTTRRAWVEMSGFIAGLVLIMWVLPMLRAPAIAGKAAAGLVLIGLAWCQVREGVSLRTVGFRFDNFWRVLGRLLIPLGVCAMGLIVAGWAAGSLRLGPDDFRHYVRGPLWGLIQQYMLLAFAGRRLRVICGPGRRSVIATAVLFGLFHFPNITLAVSCAIGGYIWTDQYERDPNLFANAVTHGLASAVLGNTLPRAILNNMVVGFPYLLR